MKTKKIKILKEIRKEFWKLFIKLILILTVRLTMLLYLNIIYYISSQNGFQIIVRIIISSDMMLMSRLQFIIRHKYWYVLKYVQNIIICSSDFYSFSLFAEYWPLPQLKKISYLENIFSLFILFTTFNFRILLKKIEFFFQFQF